MTRIKKYYTTKIHERINALLEQGYMLHPNTQPEESTLKIFGETLNNEEFNLYRHNHKTNKYENIILFIDCFNLRMQIEYQSTLSPMHEIYRGNISIEEYNRAKKRIEFHNRIYSSDELPF